ncbi:hypothetical protein ICN48_07305 [Polynucleobacter sp. JS-Safj-400b-B2]|uniref:LPD5 domain-containing protein n=1 Tax=Polynucleobacter sp. JS-Safj-400b-B2 TaxID=2576921 RepID=UPI001C0C5121|nr:LPD5 domain-containing protein [Polynucleobacter sp. JS-Safj-400b-B2]MBU3626039.1 hypothetical protein [Polynucleobacter sp. JS-Safj-400b-B2]
MKPYPPQEKQEQAQLRAKRSMERAAEQALELAKREERYSKVAALSEHIWASTAPALDDHPYLVRKGIAGENLHEIDLTKLSSLIGYAPKANGEPLSGRILLAGVGQQVGQNQKIALSTLEMIDEAGRKSALAGGRKSQSYWVAQNPLPLNSDAKPVAPIIYIGEGIATTRSIEQSYTALKGQLGLPEALIVASLSSGNMPSVAQTLRMQYPRSMIVLASDIGRGERESIQAALLVDGLVAKPSFSQADLASPKATEKTDFNDLQLISGNQSVVLGLLAAQSPRGLGFELHEGRVVATESSVPVQVIPPEKEVGAASLASQNPPATLLESITIRGFEDPERAAAEIQFSKLVNDNPRRFIDRYKQDPRSHGGLYVNSDLFKETFELYAQSNETRSFYNLPAHNSAAVLAAALFRENLAAAQAQIKEGGVRGRVLLVTGTPGAGKSSAIATGLGENFDIATIFEGQLVDVAATKIKIDQILEKGLRPEIITVHAKAENALDNALNRFEQVGRGASIDLIANLLSRLPQSLAEVHQTYGGAVKLTIIDRRDVDNSLITLSWDNLPTLSSEGTYEHIRERLSKHLEERNQSGSISLANYEQARGRAPIRPSIGIRQASSRGPEQDEQRSRVSQEDTRAKLLKLDDFPPISAADLRQYGQSVEALHQLKDQLLTSIRVFAFHEASSEPLEIRDIDVLNRYTYDQLLTLPIDFAPSKAPEFIPGDFFSEIELPDSDLNLLSNTINRISTASDLAQFENALEVIFGKDGPVRDYANDFLILRMNELTGVAPTDIPDGVQMVPPSSAPSVSVHDQDTGMESVYLPATELAKLSNQIALLETTDAVRSYQQALEIVFGQTGAVTEYAALLLAAKDQELMLPSGLDRNGDQQFDSQEANFFLSKQDLAAAITEQQEEVAAKFGENLAGASQEHINAAPFLDDTVSNSPKVIEDFGQKIGGARKDVWSGYLDKLKHSQNLTPREVPLSQYWPEPNYQKLIEAGHDRKAVAILRVLRDVVPTKPKSSYKLSAWNKKVAASKSLAEQIIGSIDKPDLLLPILDQFKTIPQISDAAILYQIAGHERSLASYQIKCASYSMMNGVSYNPPKAIWSIEERSAKTSWPKQLLTAETKEALLAKIDADHKTLLAATKQTKANGDAQFALYRKKAGEALYIGKKIGRRYIDLAGPFEDVKVAREYRHEHSQELEKELARLKEVPSIRATQNEPRLGVDYRQGQDISPAEFNEVFGFRGVEFGNWVEQGRRQADLNEAYDALMDLSRALALPPAALSFNGELGLAFGARGRGGVDPAKAHYESGHVVINLTKEKGAGSLAHEWWHALDNYLVRSSPDGNPLGFVSDEPQAVGLREPLQDAFTAVMAQIKQSDLPKRSAKMDAFRGSAYWSTPTEMSARSFEGFVGDRLSNLGIRNDYLVNYLAPKEWSNEDLPRYPYPVGNEAWAFNQAFTNLFAQVQTRQTERGVAIFNTIPKALSANEQVSFAAASERIDELLKPFAKETRTHIHLIERMDSIGIMHPPGMIASGVTCADHCFLAQEGLRDVVMVEKTLWHEMLHLGLRRFLTPQQYIENLNELYTQDQWIANKAKEWFDSADGQQVLKMHPDNIYYVRARGVDEALAQLAEITQSYPTGYRLNGLADKTYRTVCNWVATIADTFGFHKEAKGWRDYAASKAARNLIASTFAKLRAGEPSIPGAMVDKERFNAALRSQANGPDIEVQKNVKETKLPTEVANKSSGPAVEHSTTHEATQLATPFLSSPSAQEIVMAKIAKDHQPPTVEPIPFNYQHPEFSNGTRPMWAPEVTPPQLIALGKEYFGSKREFVVPMQDGGPYKGEIYHHDDRFLFQQLGDDKFTLHQVTDLSSQSPIVKERMGKSFTGIYLSIHYEGNKGVVNPYDPFKDRFISNAQLVEKAAVDRDFSQKNQNLFKTMWRVALEDVMRARMGFPKAVAIVGEQTKPPGVLDPYYQDLKAFYQKQQLEDRAKAIKKASLTKVEEKAIATTGPKR